MPTWISQLMKTAEQFLNLQKPRLGRDTSPCCTRGICWLDSQGLIGKLGTDGSFQETGDKFICDNLCEKSKAVPVLSLIRNKTCNGKIIGKVVRYCQSPVKAKAKCHFLGNAAVLNGLCIRVHYSKKGWDGQFDSNSVASDRQITAQFFWRTSIFLIDRKCQWVNLWITDQTQNFNWRHLQLHWMAVVGSFLQGLLGAAVGGRGWGGIAKRDFEPRLFYSFLRNMGIKDRRHSDALTSHLGQDQFGTALTISQQWIAHMCNI